MERVFKGRRPVLDNGATVNGLPLSEYMRLLDQARELEEVKQTITNCCTFDESTIVSIREEIQRLQTSEKDRREPSQEARKQIKQLNERLCDLLESPELRVDMNKAAALFVRYGGGCLPKEAKRYRNGRYILPEKTRVIIE